METITIKDKTFAMSLPGENIIAEVKKLAARMTKDLNGKSPLFLSVLNGSFIFAADLFRHIDIPAEISFVKMQSYQGTSSTGVVKELIGVPENVKGRCVVIVEDIVETGKTINKLVERLQSMGPSEIHICSLLLKPECYKGSIPVEYVALNIPNDFIVGYGLDYDGYGRNLRDIYTVVE